MKKLSSAKLDFHSVDYYIKHNNYNETLKRISTFDLSIQRGNGW